MAGRKTKLQLISEILKDYPDGLTAREIASKMTYRTRLQPNQISSMLSFHTDKGFVRMSKTRVMNGINWKDSNSVVKWGIK